MAKQLAAYLAQTQPNLKSFTARNLFRMRQFYETYQGDSIVTPLVTQLPWTHNLIILSQSKYPEERPFYIKMAIQERWSKRELERQFDAALFERVVLNPVQTSPKLTRQFSDLVLVETHFPLLDFHICQLAGNGWVLAEAHFPLLDFI